MVEHEVDSSFGQYFILAIGVVIGYCIYYVQAKLTTKMTTKAMTDSSTAMIPIPQTDTPRQKMYWRKRYTDNTMDIKYHLDPRCSDMRNPVSTLLEDVWNLTR